MLKIWTEKYWYDFHADCPQLGEEALAWLKSICNDPAAGGGPNVAPEALTGTAKVAGNLYEKLTQQIKNPLAKRLQMVHVRSVTSYKLIFQGLATYQGREGNTLVP